MIHAMAEPQAVDPIQYPTVLIDGVSVAVKFRVGDILRLRKNGIDIGAMTEIKGVDAFERTIALLQAGISHTMKKTVEELADLVDLADFPRIVEAINGAFLKASAQVRPATQPSPETPPIPAVQ